ncbi:MAG: hypothetical protein ACRDVZ_09770 [Jiangellaceae bacterium]
MCEIEAGFNLVVAVALVLAAAVWVGGFVVISVVARVARRTIPSAGRVAFFQALGRAYGMVAGLALAVALGAGALLVRDRPWDGLMVAAAIASGVLVATTAIGVAQARRMTRLRRAALAHPPESLLALQVRREARGAGLLRSVIGVVSLALVALGVLIAT